MSDHWFGVLILFGIGAVGGVVGALVVAVIKDALKVNKKGEK